jgi:hypothetical protein
MKKIKVLIQRYNAEIELATSIDVQVGQYVVIHAPEGYEANGKYMTAEVISVSTEVGTLEEKFVQKIETNYYDQMQLAKAEKLRMRAIMDKFWSDKTDDQKLSILETTEPPIEETVETVEDPVSDPVVEEPVTEETAETTTTTDEVTP